MSENSVAEKLASRFGVRIMNIIDGDQFELENGSKYTINPCRDSSYPGGSWYVSVIDANGNKDRTMVVDDEGNILN